MSVLDDGDWRVPRTDDEPDGAFDRSETAFRERIRDTPNARFAPEADRYHLYIARACPWAHGAALVRELLGLDDVLSMDIVDPYRDERGWRFSPEHDGCTPDTVTGADYLAEVYRAADPDFDGHVSVPVLWDREHGTIVNNESIEVMQQLATAFDEHQSNDVDLYPAGRRDEIDSITTALYEPVNNGVYRAGFASSQAAYDTAVAELFEALGELDSLLADQRYLAGDRLTIADLRLFPTLVRFDEVYHTHFRCNRRRLTDYPNLWGYTRELFQLPGVADTVNMAHIKEHYYTTHDSLNPKRIIPVGPEPDFEAPHDRDRLAGGPPTSLQG
ncbi:MAG: glutathione S-transferase family protein [Halobacteriales archaeon]|nr:glutathione S-transferase family protein [Halobacteriales archaeon]